MTQELDNTRVLNGFCFMLNSLAMGDVIAAAPVVKYMIERYYTDPNTYRVVAKAHFRSIFWFVPDSNFHPFENAENEWGIPKTWAIGVLNQKGQPGVNIIRNTPKCMHLSQFAAFKLCDRLLSPEFFNYVPMPRVDISKFDHDFSKSVILVSTYRDVTRAWSAESILTLAAWIKTQGFTPVFVGRTDMDADTPHLIPKTNLPDNLSGLGLDLRNQTTIPELATIIAQSRAIVGLDSGPIHLAGTTRTPIVCGYTTVDPKYRVPYRKAGVIYAISPGVSCRHCESNWEAHFHNFERCPFGTSSCCADMTADKFIEPLKKILLGG